MTTRYCHFCGHGPVSVILDIVECSDCHAHYALGKVIVRPTITEEEADTLFTKKELTDLQKYGGGKRKFKK